MQQQMATPQWQQIATVWHAATTSVATNSNYTA